jgi:hypothetical protein
MLLTEQLPWRTESFDTEEPAFVHKTPVDEMTEVLRQYQVTPELKIAEAVLI